VGRADFAPVMGIVLIFLVAHFVQYGLKTHWFNLPGLVECYGRLPL
jgi:hypothetical protein